MTHHWSVSATTHSSPDRDITLRSGSLYSSAVPAAIISSLMIGFTSLTCSAHILIMKISKG